MIPTVNNLAALRAVSTFAGGDPMYVLGHTNPGDGGGGFFYFSLVLTGADNDGTIVKPASVSPAASGRWLRQIDGFINVRFFGAYGSGSNYTTQVQAAIDFAAGNHVDQFFMTGNTVFFPRGNYIIDHLVLKRGVSLIGESADTCVITADAGDPSDYLLEMDEGRILWCNIANLSFASRHDSKGCMHFKGRYGVDGDGGMWQCTFKNISITGYNGHGIYLEGGTTDYLLPNQFMVFENICVVRQRDEAHSLKMSGQQGQLSFINCVFDGKNNKGQNVYITGSENKTSAVVTFMNCTVQSAEYGIWMEYAENITIDNCWFENLDLAITANGSKQPCKSINILNSRFANAAGYGSLEDIPGTFPPGTGRCIDSINSEVNVLNNYVTVSDPSQLDSFFTNERFVLADKTNEGVNTFGNSFQAKHLGLTYGLMQYVTVQPDSAGNYIDTKNNKMVFVDAVNSPAVPIQMIRSAINAGEYLFIRADQGKISFDNSRNIFLTHRPTLTLNNGDAAVFTKIDNIIGTSYRETFQLVSFINASTP